MERVASIRMSVQSPVECVMNSMGLAPRPACSAFHARRSSGISAARKIAIFVRRNFIRKVISALYLAIYSEAAVVVDAGGCRAMLVLDGRGRPSLHLPSCARLGRTNAPSLHEQFLEILFQVHAGVEACHLVVSIEHQRRALQEFTQAAFLGLAPARMIDAWIHVRIETVFAGSHLLPGVQGLVAGEADADDRLRAFESILPWNYDAEWSAVLIWERLAVQTETKQGERMHGFVHTKTRDIRPLQDAGALGGHLFGIVQGGELDELCFGQRVGALDQFAQGKSDPRNTNRPAPDTAMAVNALFGRSHFYDCVDV